MIEVRLGMMEITRVLLVDRAAYLVQVPKIGEQAIVEY
jgi:hypothetical protein